MEVRDWWETAPRDGMTAMAYARLEQMQNPLYSRISLGDAFRDYSGFSLPPRKKTQPLFTPLDSLTTE